MGKPQGSPRVPVVELRMTMDVTPRLAMTWIAFAWTKYGNGRNFYPTQLDKIESYAEDMLDGRWQWSPTQDSINLDDGLVTNGRHRLHAILLSGRTIKCNVVFRDKLPEEVKTNGSSNSSE